MRPSLQFFCAAIILLISFGRLDVSAQSSIPASIALDSSQKGPAISSNLFGIFFEEINSAGDGGIYAEMAPNRAFQDAATPDDWTLRTNGSATGQMSIDTSMPLSPTNTQTLKLTMLGGSGSIGVVNSGYWGMALQQGATYDIALYARASSGFTGAITVSLENSAGSAVYGQNKATNLSTAWQRFQISLRSSQTDPAGALRVRISQPGTVWLGFVSCFPDQTFNNRTNGLRPDLANALLNLRPSFMRFPGGSWIDGYNLADAYHWEPTVGALYNRLPRANLWGYMVDNGLGYHEYLQMCEDIGAQPLLVINCGMDVNQNPAPDNQLASWVQEALDAIQYANGDTTTFWGAQRAANGHPAPFNLQLMEIGNENAGADYDPHYAAFYDAIKSSYPYMHLIADSQGSIPVSRPVEIIDEHYYSDPTFFMNNATRYDSYSRSGPKVYVGEYAVTAGAGNGNLAGALGEAAFMTGMERNSDIVAMASYAPLFANLNNKDWNPDLIYFNGSQVYGTPSYYVQQLFSVNRGDYVVPTAISISAPPATNHGAIGLGTWNTQSAYSNLTVVANGQTLYQSDFTQGAAGWSIGTGTWVTSNGSFEQTAGGIDHRATTGATTWSNYTYHLKAMKLGGAEGFLIMFNYDDSNNWMWWNIGGWNNTQTAIEYTQNGAKATLTAVPMSIQSGQWYDISIQLGSHIRCYLNGQLIHDVAYPNAAGPLFVSSSYSQAWGQVIVKAVNTSGNSLSTSLSGAPPVSPTVAVSQLASADPANENSLAQPTLVSPVQFNLTNGAAAFTLPPYSMSVLRLQTLPTLPAQLGFVDGNVTLTSFITNSVSVHYVIDSPGGVVTNGALQIQPGALSARVPLPPLQPGLLYRITLSQPAGCELAGATRSYVAGSPAPLSVASFPDERLIYWNAPAAQLLKATNVSGPWQSAANISSPIHVPESASAEYFRLTQ